MAEQDKIHVGPIHSAVAGRTDHLPINVPSGAYVVPAETVSSIGQGNTMNGFQQLNRVFGVQKVLPEYTPTPIVAAGGEYVIGPVPLRDWFGADDLEYAHKEMDAYIMLQRKDTIKTLKNLSPPKKN